MNLASRRRRYVFLLPLSILALAASACTGEISDSPEDYEALDSTSESVSASWLCDVGQIDGQRCQNTIADIRAQAAAAGRSEILERGISWLEAGVIYNRQASYEGFRRDCSGFLSMCWQLSANPSTAWFPPFVEGTYAVSLGSLDELAPGDAVNRTYRKPYGHIMLFAGWAAPDHSQLYFIHHYATGKPVGLIQVARSQLDDYVPVRSINAPEPSDWQEPPAPSPEPAEEGCGVLWSGQSLGVDQAVSSCDGRFSLVQQSDGNLVLYKSGAGAIWNTGTWGTEGSLAAMQEDGNLVVYSRDGQPLWDTSTWGHPDAWLAIQDDGNLVIYENGPIWSSGTYGY